MFELARQLKGEVWFLAGLGKRESTPVKYRALIDSYGWFWPPIGIGARVMHYPLIRTGEAGWDSWERILDFIGEQPELTNDPT